MNVIEVPKEAVETKRAKRFVATVSVARVGDVEALIDTGAGVSMVKGDILPEHVWSKMEEYRGVPLRDAGSRPLYPIGAIGLTIRNGSEVTELPGMAVVDACPYEMLLGSDYLEKVGGFIN